VAVLLLLLLMCWICTCYVYFLFLTVNIYIYMFANTHTHTHTQKFVKNISSLSNFFAVFRYLRDAFHLPDHDDDLSSEVVNHVIDGNLIATVNLVLFTLTHINIYVCTYVCSVWLVIRCRFSLFSCSHTL
jgi:hypothetical protein